MTVPIVFIQLQNLPQSYMFTAIQQARRWNPDIPIVVLSDICTDSVAGETWIPISSIPRSDAHARFLNLTSSNDYYNTFRGGFWRVTTERLFVLEEWMRSTGTTECIHMENDILIYESVSMLLPKFRSTSKGISVTFNGQSKVGFFDKNDQPEVCFSIVYCCKMDALADFCRFLATPSIQNEMVRGGGYWLLNEDTCSLLPTAPPGTVLHSEDFREWIEVKEWSEMERVFDAATYGQFIGGNDPRNMCDVSDNKYYGLFDHFASEFKNDIIPFINMTCDFRSDQFTYGWGSDAGRRFPYILDKEGRQWKICNLHIHSKRLSEFV